MRPHRTSGVSRSQRGRFPAVFASLLACALLCNGASAKTQDGPAPGKRARESNRPLSKRERAEHAVDRLTFGPTPGEIEEVERMGVMRWIALQLSPEKIDDSALEARFQDYPALQLPLAELIADFPSPALIRGLQNGRIPLPSDPAERAIYQDQLADLKQREQFQATRAAKGSAGPPPPAGATTQEAPAGKTMPGAPARENGQQDASLLANERKLYSDLDSTSVLNLPPKKRFDKLLNMPPEQFRGLMKSLTGEERFSLTEGMPAEGRETVLALVSPDALVAGELLESRLLTDVYSQRQLQAVMIDFWLNHFNVYLRKGQFAPWDLVDFERNAIAPHALGRFEDLLVATAQSPAMLFYLDNVESVGPHSLAAQRVAMYANRRQPLGLNENYGRELMELHTLGVNGGYTQKDVTEAAKVLTGWTIEAPMQGGGFVFNGRRHEPGPKYVLGQTIPEGGEQEGLTLLHILASSPATAHHLSWQLAERFVSDSPPPALVDRMARTYLKTGGDIREVLRTMFASPEFWSRAFYRAQFKTPEEFVISAVRATDGQIVRPVPVLGAIARLGMPFYGYPSPNGYAWNAAAWVNTGDLLGRMNTALALTHNRLGTVIDLDRLVPAADPRAESAEEEGQLETLLLQKPLTPPMREAILQQAAGGALQNAALPNGNNRAALPKRAALGQMINPPTKIPPPADPQVATMAGLLLGSPGFQRK